jgi:hypothetical protein
MLTSENGIRESHSGQKYERIDIRNRKLTKVCLTAPMASHWGKYYRVRTSRVTLPPKSYGAYPDVASERDGHAGAGGSSGKCGDGRLADRDKRASERPLLGPQVSYAILKRGLGFCGATAHALDVAASAESAAGTRYQNRANVRIVTAPLDHTPQRGCQTVRKRVSRLWSI